MPGPANAPESPATRKTATTCAIIGKSSAWRPAMVIFLAFAPVWWYTLLMAPPEPIFEPNPVIDQSPTSLTSPSESSLPPDIPALPAELEIQPKPKKIWPKKKKPTHSRKPPGLKAEVITRRVLNQSKRKIAMDLGITRNTVTCILEESNIEQHLKSGKIQCVGLIPQAIVAVRDRLEKGDGMLGIKLLEDLGVIGERATPEAQKHALSSVFQHCQVLISQAGEALPPIPASTVPEPLLEQAQVIENKGKS